MIDDLIRMLAHCLVPGRFSTIPVRRSPGRVAGIRGRLILCAISVSLLLTACHSGPKAIPEGTMRSIMRDMLVSQSVLQVDKSALDGMRIDSVEVQTAILGKYGYTMDDFRFTVREMSMRKSNPLANILSGVAADIKYSRVGAEGRYKEQLRIDSIAQARTSDTVFTSDTVLRGKLDGYRIAYTGPEPADSSVPAGTYRIAFEYSTGSHARSYTKSVRAKRTERSGKTTESTLWLPTAKDTVGYEEEISVGGNAKLLEMTLSEIVRRDLPADTCYLTDIRLVHVLPVRLARRQLFEQLTVFPEQLYLYYEKRYFDSLQTSGGPVPPFAGR